MPMPILVYTIVDNNGGKAQTRVRLREELTYPQALAFALELADKIAAVIDGRILQVAVRYEYRELAIGTHGPDSDVTRSGILFYRNGEDCASIRVPALALLYAETSGPYAGVRISRDRLELLAVLSQVEGLLAGALDGLGRPYGTVFSVGGYTKV